MTKPLSRDRFLELRKKLVMNECFAVEKNLGGASKDDGIKEEIHGSAKKGEQRQEEEDEAK